MPVKNHREKERGVLKVIQGGYRKARAGVRSLILVS